MAARPDRRAHIGPQARQAEFSDCAVSCWHNANSVYDRLMHRADAPSPDAPDADPVPILPALLGLSDIERRWVYTREGIRQLMRQDPEFPRAVAAVNGGRTRLWLEADIAAYEQERGYLTEVRQKRARNRHFAKRPQPRHAPEEGPGAAPIGERDQHPASQAGPTTLGAEDDGEGVGAAAPQPLSGFAEHGPSQGAAAASGPQDEDRSFTAFAERMIAWAAERGEPPPDWALMELERVAKEAQWRRREEQRQQAERSVEGKPR